MCSFSFNPPIIIILKSTIKHLSLRLYYSTIELSLQITQAYLKNIGRWKYGRVLQILFKKLIKISSEALIITVILILFMKHSKQKDRISDAILLVKERRYFFQSLIFSRWKYFIISSSNQYIEKI